MSRHSLPPRPDVSHVIRVDVGWDRPLQIFYVQIFTSDEAEDEDGQVFLWLGTAPGELPTAEAVITVVRPYAIVDEGLARQLKSDMEVTRSQVDGAHQAAMKRQMFGSIH